MGLHIITDLENTSSLRDMFSKQSSFSFLEAITDQKANYRYAPGKWSVKQVVGHIADHERIKTYRAFLFSRQMEVQLWGYDQDLLVNNSNFQNLSLDLLIQDFKNVRHATIGFIDTLSQKQLSLVGFIGKQEVTLEAYLISIIGHEIHHINIIREKYY
ncbi:MAG: DinB family protein [Sphingobacteriales bacterium]|nr:MAG: DinB family protein [Sphingobacteriales bacterium]